MKSWLAKRPARKKSQSFSSMLPINKSQSEALAPAHKKIKEDLWRQYFEKVFQPAYIAFLETKQKEKESK
jgi:hypothetical protein